MIPILDLEYQELQKQLTAMGMERFRIAQVLQWIYKKRAASFDDWSDLSHAAREQLKNIYALRTLTIVDKKVSLLDGTIRYQFMTADDLCVAAVWLPQKDKNSICLSTQAGCGMGCYFCASGKSGLARNLSRGEILEQILQAENDTNERASGVLLMGMGEPLANYSNVTSAVKMMLDKDGFGVGRRHITLSTVGIVPRINDLAQENLGVRLALSLHAPNDDIRAKLMPGKTAAPVKDIVRAGLAYSRKTNSRMTVEYLMVSGINDSMASAKELVKLLEEYMRPTDELQINLIPYNTTITAKKTVFKSPDKKSIFDFRDYLVKRKFLANIRQAKGADIEAACGQLGV